MMVEVPILDPKLWTRSPNGSHGHWSKTSRRRKRQRALVGMHLMQMPKRQPPCTVRLTRISAGQLDTDNLGYSLKAVRDAVAEWLDCDDSPDAPVTWEYAQERCKRGHHAVRIEVKK